MIRILDMAGEWLSLGEASDTHPKDILSFKCMFDKIPFGPTTVTSLTMSSIFPYLFCFIPLALVASINHATAQVDNELLLFVLILPKMR